ncbi:MAG TPA: valine--tRNA ligase, partial [Candidatus Krumholzibacteria bacterium]|nr:valine--tRNA ligase [Candidatus Krumholzibacteria bacterium]
MDKHFDPRGLEQKWYERWEAARLFKPESHGSGEPYVITLPPPNVTGVLHIGHCLGNSVQDCLIRYYRMKGRPALWIPGTDHASIATENKVTEELAKEGLSRENLGRQKFLERAWDWSTRHHDHIVLQLKRFGGSLDWDREAFTLDEARSRAVTEAFVRLYEKGLIYRGDYMVNWSVAQQSAVSDEEVEYREVEGKLWHFRYPLKDGGYLTIATTRPETMLGDTAVAIHPDNPKTAHLRGKTVLLPLVERKIPVIEDDYVDPEFGSGCVKITPSHDPNDYEIGKRHDLPFVNILRPDGKLSDTVPERFRGLDRFEARERVVKELQELGLVEKVQPHVHNVGYHDRTGTIIEPFVSTQWFLKMEGLAQPALKAVQEGEITLFPERWVGVYYNWMTKIRDWCISRQLWWGHRIPVWYCPEGHVNVAREKPAKCAECDAAALRQEEDVLDTWFSSWLWTFSPLGWPDQTEDLKRYHPTSTLVTGHEIIFFWVARMIMASYEFLGEKPFSEVVFTGIVRDDQGRKMSKSLGNSPDPIEIIEKYGADALRFVLLMLAPTGQDINFGEEMVETGQHFCNKIWNATRLLFSNLDAARIDFPCADPVAMAQDLGSKTPHEDPETVFATLYRKVFGSELPEVPTGPLRLEDRWILQELADAASRVGAAIESRRLNDAA